MWIIFAILILAVFFIALRAILRQTDIRTVPAASHRTDGTVCADKFFLLVRLSESERSGFGKVDFKDQNEPQRVFSAIWDLDSQISNGGLVQFFQNCDSDVIEYAPTALRAIGGNVTARILSDAIQILAPIPQTPEDREAKLEDLSENALGELWSLNDKLFAKPEDLTELLFAFVAGHPEEFGEIGQP